MKIRDLIPCIITSISGWTHLDCHGCVDFHDSLQSSYHASGYGSVYFEVGQRKCYFWLSKPQQISRTYDKTTLTVLQTALSPEAISRSRSSLADISCLVYSYLTWHKRDGHNWPLYRSACRVIKIVIIGLTLLFWRDYFFPFFFSGLCSNEGNETEDT